MTCTTLCTAASLTQTLRRTSASQRSSVPSAGTSSAACLAKSRSSASALTPLKRAVEGHIKRAQDALGSNLRVTMDEDRAAIANFARCGHELLAREATSLTEIGEARVEARLQIVNRSALSVCSPVDRSSSVQLIGCAVIMTASAVRCHYNLLHSAPHG